MGVAVMSGSVTAAETLFNNRVWNVNETGETGTLWAFSRDIFSGVSKLTLKMSGDSSIQVLSSEQATIEGPEKSSDEPLTAVQDGILNDVLAEHRRTPSVHAGKLGYVLPSLGITDKDEEFLKPEGFFSIRGLDDDDIIATPLQVPDAYKSQDSTMKYAVSGFAYDSSEKKLWIARGTAGLGLYDFSKSKVSNGGYALNVASTPVLDSATRGYTWDEKNNPAIFGVALDPESGDLWMATTKGMWIRKKDGSVKNGSKLLESERVTGVWAGGKPFQVIAETSEMDDGSMKGGLWRLAAGASDFAKVAFLDTAGKAVKKNVYDDGDYTISNVAFIDSTAFVGVMVVASKMSGYFKLDSKGIRAWDTDDDGHNTWLYGYASGVTDRDVRITSICTFPLTDEIQGLAVSTDGNGISVSADQGRSWTTILNRAKLGNDLGSVRMVPSVLLGEGSQSLVSYKVSKASKITIEVFSYDMRKVRTIVKDAPRQKDASRSTLPKEDFWDGKDDHGKPCTMGVYYVRVKDNHGHVGWGKVMTVGGRR